MRAKYLEVGEKVTLLNKYGCFYEATVSGKTCQDSVNLVTFTLKTGTILTLEDNEIDSGEYLVKRMNRGGLRTKPSLKHHRHQKGE